MVHIALKFLLEFSLHINRFKNIFSNKALPLSFTLIIKLKGPLHVSCLLPVSFLVASTSWCCISAKSIGPQQ